jgi:hypothetical protein
MLHQIPMVVHLIQYIVHLISFIKAEKTFNIKVHLAPEVLDKNGKPIFTYFI